MTTAGPTSADVTATFCATLVDEWVRCGVTDAVISPGSRSTPLALALAAEERLAVHVHHDERSAAFTALGLGLASGRPAVLLCTSGTAAVEFHPAVVEAHQARVPLLVVTADRPWELLGVGAPQTVDQTKLYGASVRAFVAPGVPAAESSGSWRSLAARAFGAAVASPQGPGPVQLNLAFREPLVGTPGPLPEGRPDGAPWHAVAVLADAPPAVGPSADLAAVARGLLVVGAGCGEPAAVLAAAERLGWPVVADARSGCRIDHPLVITTFDQLARHEPTAAALTPELVVRLGEPLASKVLGQWLDASGARQVVVDRDGIGFDPARVAAEVITADPARWLGAVAAGASVTVDAAWVGDWQRAEATARAVVAAELAGDDLTEAGVARHLLGDLPADATLVVSSSMPVRDVEWFGGLTGGTRVLSNRGANGIDGVLSTAVGTALAARGTGARTAVLLGDVAFLHDTNGLLGLARRDVDLVVVVVDNDGGGIFSFLSQATTLETERFELLFGTPHGVDLAKLAEAHGLALTTAKTVSAFRTALHRAVDAGGVHLLRVVTDRRENVTAHRRVQGAVEAALARR